MRRGRWLEGKYKYERSKTIDQRSPTFRAKFTPLPHFYLYISRFVRGGTIIMKEKGSAHPPASRRHRDYGKEETALDERPGLKRKKNIFREVSGVFELGIF